MRREERKQVGVGWGGVGGARPAFLFNEDAVQPFSGAKTEFRAPCHPPPPRLIEFSSTGSTFMRPFFYTIQ